MDITDLVETLRQDLARAADVGGPETRAAGERLLLALDPALRLTLMDALSQAATEIGAALPGVAVSVRLQGREPIFVVEGAPQAAAPAEPAFEEAVEGEPVARITLRIPEALKTRAETLAAQRGQSLNTWLVGAARAAVSDTDNHPFTDRGRHGRAGRHIKGWAK
ncbi:MAG TPA: toxin-antitoxin system HicB family antitoxin [Caulobacteraceae bacterium]|jgi:hypothetical protein|nr:toxin-antitoxin system HicB family antitoxin [Caulobacteraceae bacterium]